MPTQSSSEVGYRVALSRRSRYDGLHVGSDYAVQVTRLSDGASVIRTFDWLINARRFARSPRRISKEFARAHQAIVSEEETFTWSIKSTGGWTRA